MEAQTETIEINVDSDRIAGTMLAPRSKLPGVLFIHGWGGNQQRDMVRAERIAALGVICLTFDLRGHQRTEQQRQTITRQQNFEDVLAAYDHLAAHPAVDASCIAVIGTSYGGYLATLLTARRPIKWLTLRAPALYWDQDWQTPKVSLDRALLMKYRHRKLDPVDNRALAACAAFQGDVLIVESETDDFVPRTTIMSYRSSFTASRSLTHRMISGADHALSTDRSQKAYSQILHDWITEMIIGSRIDQSALPSFS